MQHKLHHLRLRQAKVTVDILEIQKVEFSKRLDLAARQWKEALPSSSASSSSLFQITLPPSQTYRLPRNAVRLSPASTSHLWNAVPKYAGDFTSTDVPCAC
jgi:hypothetical protein